MTTIGKVYKNKRLGKAGQPKGKTYYVNLHKCQQVKGKC